MQVRRPNDSELDVGVVMAFFEPECWIDRAAGPSHISEAGLRVQDRGVVEMR